MIGASVVVQIPGSYLDGQSGIVTRLEGHVVIVRIRGHYHSFHLSQLVISHEPSPNRSISASQGASHPRQRSLEEQGRPDEGA